MNKLTLALLVTSIVLASALGYLSYQLATEPSRTEVLTGLTQAEAKTLSALAPIISFSAEDVPGEIGGEAFIDDLGRAVSISGEPQRIVSLHPAAVETLFRLGADDRLVAVSNAWTGDPWAAEEYGGPGVVESWITTPEAVDNEIEKRVAEGVLVALNAFAVNPEAILDLSPDVVIVFGATLPSYAAAIANTGVPVIALFPTSLEDVLYDLVLIGKVVGKSGEAQALVDDIKHDITDIAGRTLDLPRPKVFCETGYNGGVWTTGEGSFVSSLIYLAGGEDIGTVVPAGNANINAEYILAQGPEILLLLDYPYADAQSVAVRSGWGTIPAVITWQANYEKGIYELSAEQIDMISRSGPRIAEGLEVLVQLIHPELSE